MSLNTFFKRKIEKGKLKTKKIKHIMIIQRGKNKRIGKVAKTIAIFNQEIIGIMTGFMIRTTLYIY